MRRLSDSQSVVYMPHMPHNHSTPLPLLPPLSLHVAVDKQEECNKNNLLLLVWLPFELFEIFILAFIVQVHSTVVVPPLALSFSLSLCFLASFMMEG